MRAFLLELLILVIIPTIIFGQTHISGGINKNTEWKKENSPYIITGNTVVFGKNTLTIEPGVVIKFEDNVQLRIQGKLSAIGNETDTIVFTSNNSNPKYGAWNEIYFEFEAECQLEFAKFEYAKNSLRFNYLKSTSQMKNLVFSNNTFAVNGNRGLRGFSFENVTFINNDIGIVDAYGGVKLTNCLFDSNRIGAELLASSVENCQFLNNSEIGLTGHTSIIRNSRFEFNNIGLEQSFSGGPQSSKMIGNNISNNNIGLSITGKNPKAVFKNNKICNNKILNVDNTSSYSGHDLSDNCWCTENINEIENKINHGLDDINVGVVIFEPIATECDFVTDVKNHSSANYKIEIFPNPANNYLNINLTDIANPESASIFDQKGNHIESISFTKGNIDKYFRIDVSQYPTGVYFIRIRNKKNELKAKFIKVE